MLWAVDRFKRYGLVEVDLSVMGVRVGRANFFLDLSIIYFWINR